MSVMFSIYSSTISLLAASFYPNNRIPEACKNHRINEDPDQSYLVYNSRTKCEIKILASKIQSCGSVMFIPDLRFNTTELVSRSSSVQSFVSKYLPVLYWIYKKFSCVGLQ
jgi:hypothetical protein